MHSGAVRPRGHNPVISLSRSRVSAIANQASGFKPKEITGHSPSNDQMDCTMRALPRKNRQRQRTLSSIAVTGRAATHHRTLELGMEPLEVTDIPLHQRLLTRRSEVLPQIIWRGRSAITEWVIVGDSYGVVPSDPVWNGVDHFEVICKSAGSDLIIVGWVAPPTEPHRRVVEDGDVDEVGASICEMGQNIRMSVSQESQAEPRTQRPIPVRLSSLIVTFGPQRGLEIVEAGTVPRQEMASVMDLK